MVFQYIIKRNGYKVEFNKAFIARALSKSLNATSTKYDHDLLAEEVVTLARSKNTTDTCTIEEIQNCAEDVLMFNNLNETAKAYIRYRAHQDADRSIVIKDYIKKMAHEELNYLKTPFAVFVYKRTYARYIPAKRRREFWPETIERFMNYANKRAGHHLDAADYQQIKRAILNLDVMPSMRLLQFAGPAAERNDLYSYNCCFLAPTGLQDFRDIMYLLMCGVGVGFSVEKQFTSQLPIIAPRNWGVTHHSVEDSKEGWCNAFYLGLTTWWAGNDICFTYEHVRPAGARLKVTGGKASGPEPLKDLLDHTRQLVYVNRPENGRLNPIDIHSIVCKIGSIVVAGSIRRSALISLSDLSDESMRDCKSGAWWENNGHFGMANNSAAYQVAPTREQFAIEWQALKASGTGERGIFNRSILPSTLPSRRIDTIGADVIPFMGTNPCGEIVLQSGGMCNLSSVICRPHDTVESLIEKVRIATIIGTFQSSLTSFNYVQDKFTTIARQERLLGVSLAGQMDCPTVRNAEVFQRLRQTAIDTNIEYAAKFGISPSTCVTTVKPDGTLGLITGASPGVHPAHAKHYIRRVRISINDPLCKFLQHAGVPFHPENGQSYEKGNVHTLVFEFPQAAAEHSVCRNDMTALEMLEYWKMVKVNYTEHNPSVTISIRENEWESVGQWVYNNWSIAGGLSFLPYSDHTYTLAPYEDCSIEDYQNRSNAIGDLNYSNLVKYDYEDETDQMSVSACSGPMCSAE